MSADEKLQAALATLGPQKSTFNPMDQEFADPDPANLERPASGGGLLDDLTPAPAPKPLCKCGKPFEAHVNGECPAAKEGELSAEEAEALKESLEFEEYRKAKQFDQRMKGFVQRHKIIPNSQINEAIFGEYLQAIGFNGDMTQITDERLEEFFQSSGSLLERQDNTPPPLNPNRPTVVYLPESQRPKPVATGLSAHSHEAPAPESEMTPDAVAAKIANMPYDEARRYMQRLMYQQNKGNRQ